MSAIARLPDALEAAPRVAATADDVAYGRLAGIQAEAAVRLGPVLRIDVPYGPEAGPCLSLVSPELAEDALLTRRQLYSSEGGWAPLLGSGFGYAVLNVDEPLHAEHRRAIVPAFAGPALQRCMPGLLRIVDEELDRWGDGRELDLFPAMRRLAYHAVARGVGGMSLDETRQSFDALSVILDGYDFMREGREAFLGRAGAARAAFLDVLAEVVARRRAGEGRGDGTFPDRVVAVIPPGETPRDAAVAFLAMLLIAGHDTGMVMYSRAIFELAARPELGARIVAELEAAGATAQRPPSVDTADRLPLLERYMLEIGRAYPSILNIPRTAGEDFELRGLRVVRGTRIAVAIAGVHLRADLHADPLRFDPDRFADPASARLAKPFQHLAFAGGARHCLGMRLAQIEFKAIVSRAMLRFRVRPAVEGPVPPGGFWVARPAGPMRLAIEPR